jgi:hypothetical protein
MFNSHGNRSQHESRFSRKGLRIRAAVRGAARAFLEGAAYANPYFCMVTPDTDTQLHNSTSVRTSRSRAPELVADPEGGSVEVEPGPVQDARSMTRPATPSSQLLCAWVPTQSGRGGLEMRWSVRVPIDHPATDALGDGTRPNRTAPEERDLEVRLRYVFSLFIDEVSPRAMSAKTPQPLGERMKEASPELLKTL